MVHTCSGLSVVQHEDRPVDQLQFPSSCQPVFSGPVDLLQEAAETGVVPGCMN